MKTKLTLQLQEHICDLISKGMYINRACDAVDISESVYYKWVQRASEEDEGIYREFVQSVKRAEASLQKKWLTNFQELGAKSWQAQSTLLERRFAKEWSQSSRGNVQVDVTHKVVNIAEIARKYDSPIDSAQGEPPEIEGEFKELKEGEDG